jgi:oligopeptide transport system ATP-binding protein
LANHQSSIINHQSTMSLLTVNNLNVRFQARPADVHAVRGVELTIEAGQTLGIVGESGCGKSTLAMAVMGLLDRRRTLIDGHVNFAGTDLLEARLSELQEIRGRRMAMIFQDPMSSLNPYLKIGVQICEPLLRHLNMSKSEAQARAVELLDSVGIANATSRLKQYPHEFSGGMCQRVMIAIALACEPELLIADEPTTALDVTIQAQILNILRDQLKERQMGVMLITHDLGVVASFCDQVAVMYAGQVVERASVSDLFNDPRHPYTQALLEAVPRYDRPVGALTTISGQPPNLASVFTGCPFAPRCDHAADACSQGVPDLEDDATGRLHRCEMRRK